MAAARGVCSILLRGRTTRRPRQRSILPGEIQVTERVVGALADWYMLEPRGTVEIKGKGAMPTWFLRGRADDGPASR
jgi:class 3 adenylate cyclase